jgi:hypothetical protein
VRYAIVAGAWVVLFGTSLATPAVPALVPRPAVRTAPSPTATPKPHPRLAASSLYSRRSQRLVRSYLRLKLLEVREADLDRARLVVERKLGIRALLGETPRPYAR